MPISTSYTEHAFRALHPEAFAEQFNAMLDGKAPKATVTVDGDTYTIEATRVSLDPNSDVTWPCLKIVCRLSPEKWRRGRSFAAQKRFCDEISNKLSLGKQMQSFRISSSGEPWWSAPVAKKSRSEPLAGNRL